ncbi:MAG: hypothetical protein HYZ53_30380 [Planctomycetes bacterium]|nr:hypothetical protein [Planctomycetota bacterium]
MPPSPPLERSILLPLALFVLLLPPAFVLADDAEPKVRAGVEHYGAGAFEASAKAFAEADVARPDDPRIAYDRGCAAAAQGEADKAAEFFQKAASARDARLALLARYDLGVLAADRGRAALGATPENAPPEARGEGMRLLAEAVGHFRDCLALEKDPSAGTLPDARHNLEVLRLWMKHMQSLWDEQDRKQKRDELDPLSFLEMLLEGQSALRVQAHRLEAEPDSPRRREAAKATETAQRRLVEELPALREKLQAALSPPAAGPPGAGPAPAPGPAPSDQERQAQELLSKWVDQAGQAMGAAADRLGVFALGPAVTSQGEALEHLDRLFAALAPFPKLVGKSVEFEQGIVSRTAPLVEGQGAPAAAPSGGPAPAGETRELAWDQTRVGTWAEALVYKAKEGLKGLDSSPPAPAPAPPGPGNGPDPEALKKRTEALRTSFQKAVELAPKVRVLATEATESLEADKPPDALPKEEEALKLLKEIAESLPKQDPKNQDQKKDEQKKDEQQKKQDERKNQGQQGSQGDQKPGELSKEDAEALLKKVRERERKHNEREKEMEGALGGPGNVDKDW